MTASPYTRLRSHWDRHGAFSGLAFRPRATPQARQLAARLAGHGEWYIIRGVGGVFARTLAHARAYARAHIGEE
jgi:dihydroorotate dehydrogenase